MGKFDAVVFDFDGTLVDSQWMWSSFTARSLRSRGYDVTDEEIAQSEQWNRARSIAYFSAKFGEPEFPGLEIQDTRDDIEKFYTESVRWKPGAEECVKALRKAGVKVCILSATPTYLLRIALKRLHAEDLFDDIISTKDLGAEKHESICFERCLARIGTIAERTAFVEDFVNNLACAKRCGLPTFAVYERCRKDEWDFVRTIVTASAETLTGLLDIFIS